jgi:hypothetical protein
MSEVESDDDLISINEIEEKPTNNKEKQSSNKEKPTKEKKPMSAERLEALEEPVKRRWK